MYKQLTKVKYNIQQTKKAPDIGRTHTECGGVTNSFVQHFPQNIEQ